VKPAATTLLLDTHVLLWWWICPRLLTCRVLARLQDPQQTVLVSAASLWELSQAHQRGLLPELSPVIWHLPELIRQERFQMLEISARDALLAGQWQQRARTSPLDATGRMLLAQAQRRNLTLVSGDVHLQHCGVPWLW
jgi:PIN domain nuclease of toxin-antitoxin system